MAIVTPIWRPALTPQEEPFVRITERANPGVDRWFCAPSGLDLAYYEREFPSWRVREFPAEAFASVHAYSYWLTGPEFYEAFAEYELLTICQTDAVLVKDVGTLDMGGVDYVGSPWQPPVKVLAVGRRLYVATDFDRREGLAITRMLGRTLDVGNGGLSTRRVATLIDVTRHISARYSTEIRRHTLEDVLLCAVGPRQGLRVAPRAQAETVYQETQVAGQARLPDVFGFHGLWRWNADLARGLANSAGDPG